VGVSSVDNRGRPFFGHDGFGLAGQLLRVCPLRYRWRRGLRNHYVRTQYGLAIATDVNNGRSEHDLIGLRHWQGDWGVVLVCGCCLEFRRIWRGRECLFEL